MDLKEQIIQTALKEIEEQSWGATEQYMQIHDVVRINSTPEVARVDMEGEDGVAVVYLPIEGEKFYLAIYIDTVPDVAIRDVNTEDNNRVYLRVVSEQLTYSQIEAMTSLRSIDGWNKGDLRTNGKVGYKYSCAIYEPNPEPDTFEDKLDKLLSYLLQDKEGVARLVSESEHAYIQVDVDIHNGNGLIGGPYLNIKNMQHMTELGLEIAFSQYVGGKPFE